ncbi:hypothetical protein [Catelliglobosispora koreensis]|uniref:hypothetical protein n=1 Tax=Catelliglobosispora koreensis TaxID=129052 RepID=UPI000363EFC5|nr:hypothetical protein [Catelliglobosispora koreensis]
MSNSFLNGAGRGRRAAVILIVAVSALALIAAIAALVLAGRGTKADTANTTPKPDTTVNVPTGPLTQIKGKSTIDGVSVGYPHTTAGAVSAAAEYAAVMGSTLDPDRARAIAQLIADASYTNAVEKAVAGRLSSRKTLGVPESGPVPTGVSMILAPAAYQLRSVTPDSMTVLLLSYLTTSDVNGTITPRHIIMPAEMHWDGSDWKLAAPPSTDSDYSSLLAQPGTADATAKGWQVIQP